MAPQYDDEPQRPQPRESTSQGPGRSEQPYHQPPDQLPDTYRGGAPAMADDTLETNEIIAVVAAVIPGLGQMLLGQPIKGLVVLAIALLTCLGGGLLSVLSILDAFLVAKAKKRRPIREWEFFPDFKDTFNV